MIAKFLKDETSILLLTLWMHKHLDAFRLNIGIGLSRSMSSDALPKWPPLPFIHRHSGV